MESQEQAIAVIGLAGRFPGARTPEELWRNLRDGVESIRFLSEAEMQAAGVPRALREDPDWVPAVSEPEGIEDFDAPFFGINHREAEILDPQHRWFLEVCWEALEDAGYAPENAKGLVGVCAGMTTSTYLFYNLSRSSQVAATVDPVQLIVGNSVDTLTTRISYRLNLKGPSHAVQSACSTSLVAVHTACQMLLQGEADMVLAGGVSINVGQRGGYRYVEDGQLSPDGHVRVFDAQAKGTVFGSGAGVVVLKRLEDALADGDSVRAVILGSAINNDGSLKVGFAAPGVDGQAEVITEALAVAGVDPESISYVEAHGSGTALGDPIEMQALNKVYKGTRAACTLGSLKSNIGHLDVASGVSGLIKTVLALQHREIPPTLHFNEPNPRIDFASSPLKVSPRLTEWKANGGPRRAGVSSFGFGGTNAHVIVEEAPPRPRASVSRPWRALTLSARTESALEHAVDRLAGHLRRHPEADLGDAAFTLLAGRRTFPCRTVVVCRDTADAVACLEGRAPERVFTVHHASEPRERPIAFLFPGEGSQHAGMARGLYASEPVFRKELDRAADLLAPQLGLDLRALIQPEEGRQSSSNAASPTETGQLLASPRIGQPALFAVEHALARLFMAWGITPQAMLGQGVGELVAACLAGVFSLEDGLALAVERGRALEAEDGSGDGAFLERLRRTRLSAPRTPFVAGATGAWIRGEEATDPAYWVRQMRAPLRLQPAMAAILAESDRVLLEIGPGDTLTAQAAPFAAGRTLLATLAGEPDTLAVARAVGRLWLEGHQLDPARLFAGQERRRMPLPTYPFERLRYWIEPDRAPEAVAAPDGVTVALEEKPRVTVAVQTLHPRPRLATPYVAPRDPMEEEIAAIWRQVLGLAEIGIYDNFLDLGGHSLLATQMLVLLREQLQVDLAIEEMFADPTVAGVAEAVTAMRANTASPDQLAALLAEIQGMSDEELEAELAQGEESRIV